MSDTIGDMLVDEFIAQISDNGYSWREVASGCNRVLVHEALDEANARHKRLVTHKRKVIWTNLPRARRLGRVHGHGPADDRHGLEPRASSRAEP